MAMPESRFHHLLRDTIVARLGPGTRVPPKSNGEPGFWVSFRLDAADDDEFWLALPRRAQPPFSRRAG